MPAIRNVLRALVAALGLSLYVWYTAVRRLPAVKRRKAARRRVGTSVKGRDRVRRGPV